MTTFALLGIVLLVMGVGARFVKDPAGSPGLTSVIEFCLLISGFAVLAVALWQMTA